MSRPATRSLCAVIIVLAVFGPSALAQPGYWVGIDPGTSDVASGITHVQPADGRTTAVDIGGLNCRRNLVAGTDNYMYFRIDDGYAFQGSRPNLYITIHYYDSGSGIFYLQYDSNTGSDTAARYKTGGSVTIEGSNTWRAWTFHVTDAYLGNRQNSGADFRIVNTSGQSFYLDLVYVRTFCNGRNECVRMVPSPWKGGDGQQIRSVFEHPEQWPIARAELDLLGTYHGPGGFQNVPDPELQQWMALVRDWGLMFSLEVGALADWPGGCDSQHLFNLLKPELDRIYAAGGRVDVFAIDEPLRKAMIGKCWGTGVNANYAPSIVQVVNWYGLMRQNYPDSQLWHIMPYRYHTVSTIQNYIRDLNNACAASAVRGMDCFSIDCDWRVFSGEGGSQVVGNWPEVITIQNYCRSRGIPFSMLYNPSRASYSGSSNNVDFYNDIMRQAVRYQSFGGQPDSFDVQSWLANLPTTIPETQNYTMTDTLVDLVAQYVPSHNKLADDAAVVSSTIPDVMAVNQQYVAAVTVRNTGALTWTRTDGYALGAVNDSDPFAANRQLLDAGESVGPNQQKTFLFIMTTPATAGPYLTDWRMVHENVGWFGQTHAKNVTLATLAVAPPLIVEQPRPRAAVAGGTVQFTVAATGAGPLSYYWFKNGGFLNNGGNVSGVNTATLTITNVQQVGDADHCRVGNAGGSAASSRALLSWRATGDFDFDTDTDLSDFGFLQNCISGTQPLTPGCEDADLDASGNVNQTDLTIFLNCLSGAGLPAQPGC